MLKFDDNKIVQVLSELIECQCCYFFFVINLSIKDNIITCLNHRRNNQFQEQGAGRC